MRTKILILTLTTFLQGCIVFGMVVDSKFPSKNAKVKGETFTEIGLKSDFELIKSVIYNEPLPGNQPKRLTGCKELTGKKS